MAAQKSLALASGLARAAIVAIVTNTGRHGELEWTARLSVKQQACLHAGHLTATAGVCFYSSNLSSTEVRFCSFTQTLSRLPLTVCKRVQFGGAVAGGGGTGLEALWCTRSVELQPINSHRCQ